MATKKTPEIDDNKDLIMKKVNETLASMGLDASWRVDQLRLRPATKLKRGCRIVTRVVWYTDPRTGRRYRRVIEEEVCD